MAKRPGGVKKKKSQAYEDAIAELILRARAKKNLGMPDDTKPPPLRFSPRTLRSPMTSKRGLHRWSAIRALIPPAKPSGEAARGLPGGVSEPSEAELAAAAAREQYIAEMAEAEKRAQEEKLKRISEEEGWYD